MDKVAIQFIRYYQYLSKNVIRHNALPLVFLSGCRYYPTCSEYTIETIKQEGLLRGLSRGLVRVIKCNPFYKTS